MKTQSRNCEQITDKNICSGEGAPHLKSMVRRSLFGGNSRLRSEEEDRWKRSGEYWKNWTGARCSSL